MNVHNNYLPPFLIIVPSFYNYLIFFPCPPTWIRKNKLMCLFMSMKYILIKIKIDIDINNDKSLKTI
jgi:hypothetical protein